MNLKLTKLSRMAAVSALALSAAGYSGAAHADRFNAGGTYELNSDNPVTIDVGATVDELVTVTTTDLDFGTIGIHQDRTGGSAVPKATAVMAAGPGTVTFTNTAGPLGSARIVDGHSSPHVGTKAPAVATVDVAGAFPSVHIYDHYTRVADLTCASGTCFTPNSVEEGGSTGSYSAPTLLMTHILDDLGTLGQVSEIGTAGTASGGCDETAPGTCTSIDGDGVTDTNGELKFHIGGTISTDGTSHYYASGTYSGSFDLTLTY